jgi:hypothetical protein
MLNNLYPTHIVKIYPILTANQYRTLHIILPWAIDLKCLAITTPMLEHSTHARTIRDPVCKTHIFKRNEMIKCKKDIKTSLSSLCLTSYANP